MFPNVDHESWCDKAHQWHYYCVLYLKKWIPVSAPPNGIQPYDYVACECDVLQKYWNLKNHA